VEENAQGEGSTADKDAINKPQEAFAVRSLMSSSYLLVLLVF
jgi:hypothetical protein